MAQASGVKNEIDLFSLLEIVWQKRVLVLAFPITFCVLISVYSWHTKPPSQYVTSTVSISPSASFLRRFAIDHPSMRVDVTSEDWLNSLEFHLSNANVLYSVLESSEQDGEDLLDWIRPSIVSELTTDQLIFEIIGPRINLKNDDQRLTLQVITDFPNTGISFSTHVLKNAQSLVIKELGETYRDKLKFALEREKIKRIELERKALKQQRIERLAEKIQEDANIVQSTSSQWVREILENTSVAELRRFSTEDLMSLVDARIALREKFYGNPARQQELKQLLIERSTPVEEITLDNPTNVSEINANIPNIDVENLDESLPPVASSKAISGLFVSKFIKMFLSAMFFGLLVGIFTALFADAYQTHKGQ